MKITRPHIFLAAGVIATATLLALTVREHIKSSGIPPEFCKMHLQCDKCGHEGFIKLSDITGPVRDSLCGNPIVGIDCPKCGAKESYFPDTLCGKCDAWNLTPWDKDSRLRVSPDRPEFKCNKCGAKL